MPANGRWDLTWCLKGQCRFHVCTKKTSTEYFHHYTRDGPLWSKFHAKIYFSKTYLATQLKTCLQNLILCYANVSISQPFLLTKYTHKNPKHSEEEKLKFLCKYKHFLIMVYMIQTSQQLNNGKNKPEEIFMLTLRKKFL
jgi:hypothetical protein